MPLKNQEDESLLSLPSLSLPAKKSGITRANNLTGRALTGPMETRGPPPKERRQPNLTLPGLTSSNSSTASDLTGRVLTGPMETRTATPAAAPAPQFLPNIGGAPASAFQGAIPTQNQFTDGGVMGDILRKAQASQAPSSLAGGVPSQYAGAGDGRIPQPNVVPPQPPPPVAPTFPGPGQQPPQAQAGAGIGTLLGPGANMPNVPSLNQPTAPQIIPAQQGTDQFSQVQPNANGALLQPQGDTRPQIQNGQSQQLQQPQNIIPEGSIEVIRGRPGGGGNAGAGGFQVNYATPNGRGGFAPEIAAPPSPVIQGQAAQAFNQRGTAQGVQAQTNLASIANPAAQGVVQQEVLNQRNFDAKAQALQAEQAQLNQPEVKTITDEYGAEKLVVFDKKTGTQKDVKDASKPTIASVMRELKAEFPDATDEEIEAFYQSMQGQ